MSGSGRATVTRVRHLLLKLWNAMPQLLKGSNSDDLKSAYRNAERVGDAVKKRLDESKRQEAPPPASDGSTATLVVEIEVLQKECDANVSESRGTDASSSRWRWVVVGVVVVVVVGGVVLWYYARRRRRRGGGGGGGGDEDGPDGPDPPAPPQPLPSPSASGSEARRIVADHRLPLRAAPNPNATAPHLDRDALRLPSAAAADHLARFSCSPVFLAPGLHKDFYDRFLPLTPSSGGCFDQELYLALLSANTQLADLVFELLNPDEDVVFIHDYHLWALPTILRHKSPRARIGFFLHAPFPSSELFRAIPVRDDIRNADLVGFNTYGYAGRFLSTCSRLVGLSNHSRRGYIGIDYFGRTIVVRILPAGVDMAQLRAALSSPETAAKATEIATEYAGRQLLLGVDDVDLFKGIGLKLLAMEKLLEPRAELRGRVVLVQIINTSPSSELFRAIPVRDDIRNADLVGFHTYDYAGHFLSSCTRLVGPSNHSRRGYIGVDYFGRTIVVRILPAGVDTAQLRAALSSPETAAKATENATEYAGRQLLLGVDDVDLFKGIGLKLLAMEKLLEPRAELRGRVVLVQISNTSPAQSLGRDIDAVRAEALATRDRISTRLTSPACEPMHDKLAFYTAADICVVTCVRDGLNRIPPIYAMCRQGPIAGGGVVGAPRESATVVSEFVGCSPSLSGAIRINPCNVDEVADAMGYGLVF